jgi:hypothetical protein
MEHQKTDVDAHVAHGVNLNIPIYTGPLGLDDFFTLLRTI